MSAAQCPAHLDSRVIMIGAESGFRCEMPAGHDSEWHERSSAPIAARWREIPDGVDLDYLRTVQGDD